MGSNSDCFSYRTVVLAAICACSLATSNRCVASISITTLGSTYTQDFDSLNSSGATGSALPNGWTFLETGGTAPTTYGINNGGSNTGNTYSYGATSSTERAFGSLASGTVSTIRIGAEFENQTGETITSLAIQYVGEQWRFGGNTTPGRPAGVQDILNFQYSLDATDSNAGTLSTGLGDEATWVDADTLDFSSIVATGASGISLDGNALANRLLISATISLSIPDGTTFWIRWRDTNIDGNDDGLAIDDFSLTARGTVEEVIPEASAALIWSILCGSVLVGAKRQRDVA